MKQNGDNRNGSKNKPVRCAIYTRKSTDENLELDFNSLDAQRDAGEAYIASQKHEGWACLPNRYDDGGFSGGTVDRPAFQRLMADGRVPRVTRLMALALRFEHLLGRGAVRDQAELAELGHVTRARVTQIMNFLHLAPDIQEQLLALPRVTEGRDPIVERQIRPIATEVDWRRQRRQWRQMLAASRLMPENSA